MNATQQIPIISNHRQWRQKTPTTTIMSKQHPMHFATWPTKTAAMNSGKWISKNKEDGQHKKFCQEEEEAVSVCSHVGKRASSFFLGYAHDDIGEDTLQQKWSNERRGNTQYNICSITTSRSARAASISWTVSIMVSLLPTALFAEEHAMPVTTSTDM